MERRFGLSGFTLKVIAVFSMLIDHIAAVIFLVAFGFQGISEMGQVAISKYFIMRSIGRIAFPIFAFLVVEGFLHTKDLKKYFLRMFIFAVISQIPYNLAFGNMVFYTEKFLPAFIFGNVMWTFLLGMAAIYVLSIVEKKDLKIFLK